MDPCRGAKRTIALGIFLLLSGCLPNRWLVQANDPLSPEEHSQLAATYEAQGLKKEAAAEYGKVLEEDPRHVPTLLALGDLAYQDGRLSRAKGYYRKALKVQPDNARANNNLAMVYLDLNKTDAAEKHARKAIDRRDHIQPYALDTLAQIYMKQKRFEDARAALAEAEGVAPPDPAFQENLKRSREKLNSLAQ